MSESDPSRELVIAVWGRVLRDAPLTTQEVSRSMDYSITQTLKALDFLKGCGAIQYETKARSGNWVLVNADVDVWERAEDELNSLTVRDNHLKS